MAGLLNGPARYAQVLYLTGPAARTVVTRSMAAVPADWQARIVIRDLPGSAYAPGEGPVA